MAHKYAEIAFTEEVKMVQEEMNSRAGYRGMETGEDVNYLLSQHEANFIAERDSFYMATVSETDWPYVQHRGGPKGFMHVLDAKTIGFADYSGNRQYVSTGNLRKNDRVSIIFMDYKNQRRLKLLGRVSIINNDDYETLAKLESADFRAPVERGFLIHVEAFDWNCPKFITPRFTETEVREIITPLAQENDELKKRLSKEGERPVNDKAKNFFGDGPLSLTITNMRREAHNIHSYELRSTEGSPLPKVTAGSHLLVPTLMADNTTEYRNYSICSDPAQQDVYEITVLNQPKGTGGSIAIHKTYRLGLELRCQMPNNNFSLKTEIHHQGTPAILIAGGIGITPIKSMVSTLIADNSNFEVHYAGRSEKRMAFVNELEKSLGNKLHKYFDDKNQRLDIKSVLENADDKAIFYLCGPTRLLEAFIREADQLGIDPSRVCFERFKVEISDDAQPVTVKLAKSGKEILVHKDQTILEALIDADVPVNYSCKVGDCRSCVVTVIEGIPDHKDTALSPYEREEQNQFCPCVSRAKSPSLTLDI